MTVNKYFMPALVILALFGTIGMARATGAWVSTGQELVENKTLTADDLRGWMTIQQVADGLHLPVETIYQLAGVPVGAPVTPDTPLKQLEESVPGFDVSGLREKVAAYLATGTVPADAEQAPQAPVQAPAETPVQPPTQAATQVSEQVPAAPAPTATPHVAKGTGTGESAPTPLPAGQILPGSQIKGSMTLDDVAKQCGVHLDELLAAAKLPANTNAAIQVKSLKDVVPGFEVQTLRDAVSALQAESQD